MNLRTGWCGVSNGRGVKFYPCEFSCDCDPITHNNIARGVVAINIPGVHPQASIACIQTKSVFPDPLNSPSVGCLSMADMG